MNRNYLSAISLIFLFNIFAAAQMAPPRQYQMYLSGDVLDNAAPSNIIGTPYLNSNFGLGILYYGGKEAITAPVRYNVFKEQIEIELDGEVYYLNPEVEVKFKEGVFKSFEYANNGKKTGYFKLYPGTNNHQQLILLEKPLKGIIEARKAAAMKTPQPARYTDDMEYYLKFSNSNVAVIAERNFNKFIKSFPEDQQDAVEKFIKDKNLKTKNEEDLLKIVAFYNSKK